MSTTVRRPDSRCALTSAMAVWSAAPSSEAVAARMEGRLEDRLQHLEHRLLSHPVHHVGNAEVPLPAAGLGDTRPGELRQADSSPAATPRAGMR